VDITKYLADLNIKLQVKELPVQNKFECIHPETGSSSEVNGAEKIVPFTTLSSRPVESVEHKQWTIHLNLLTKLSEEFNSRFHDFKTF